MSLIAQGHPPPAQLLLIDFSLGMLRHSPSGSSFTHPVVADAERLPLRADTVDLLVAPLGAPFNGETFWQEAARVVRPGCHAVYTGPAHEWALDFRNGSPVAEYHVGDAEVCVPSWTRTVADQRRLTSSAGFETVEEAQVRLSALGHVVSSPKISVGDGEDPVVVNGILVRKAPG